MKRFIEGEYPVKRTRVRLSIAQKKEVIKKLEAGCKVTAVASEFGCGLQTIRDIRKKDEMLKGFGISLDSSVQFKQLCKSLKRPTTELVELPSHISLESELTRVQLPATSVTHKTQSIGLYSSNCNPSTLFPLCGDGESPTFPVTSVTQKTQHIGSDSSHFNPSTIFPLCEDGESPVASVTQKTQSLLGLDSTHFSSSTFFPSCVDGESPKRSRVRLSIAQKREVIQKLKAGCKVTAVAAEYGCGVQTVRDIKRKELELDLFEFSFSSPSCDQRKSLKRPTTLLVDEATYAWFQCQRTAGVEVSGSMLKNKALEFNSLLNGPSTFLASCGWLSRFRTRHCLNNNASNDAAVSFISRAFPRLLGNRQIPQDKVPNAEEAGLVVPETPASIFSSASLDSWRTILQNNSAALLALASPSSVDTPVAVQSDQTALSELHGNQAMQALNGLAQGNADAATNETIVNTILNLLLTPGKVVQGT